MTRGVGHLIANVLHLFTLLDPAVYGTDPGMAPTEMDHRWISEKCHAALRVLTRAGHLAEPNEAPVVVQEILHEIEEWAELQGGVERAPCHVHCPEKLSAAGMPAVEILHAIMSIITNAKEAVQGKPDGNVRVEAGEGDGVIFLEVSDNGPGFDPAILSSACEPFVTTRENRLGLGLAAARVLVERRGGTLHIESSGNGALVRVTIPVWKRPSMRLPHHL
ncbi:MAG: ATP-binding protein [Gemmatimonadota bacterium]